jgi:DeoR family transcriptional regulator of aga operon
MPARPPPPPPRERRVVEEVLRAGAVSVDALAERLQVSPATVRRDLTGLEQRGLLRRTHGGAVPIEPIHSDLFLGDSSFQEQMRRHAPEKRRIALAAADLVEDGDTIALTPGTTTALLARCLRHRRNITVVTNTVNVALELCQREGISVFVTGGYLRAGWFSMVGPAAVHALGEIYVDKVFIGVNGIHPVRGLTAGHPDEAMTNRAMIGQAREKIVVADHAKLGKVASALIGPAAGVSLLITDTGASDAAVAPFRKLGIEVRRV